MKRHKEMAVPLVRWPDGTYYRARPYPWRKRLEALGGFLLLLAFTVMVVLVASLGVPAP